MSTSQMIKDAMKARGMSQSDICAATGMKPTLLARMLRDDDHNYTVKTLSRIAAALESDLSIVFRNSYVDVTAEEAWADRSLPAFSVKRGGVTYESADGVLTPSGVEVEDFKITYSTEPCEHDWRLSANEVVVGGLVVSQHQWCTKCDSYRITNELEEWLPKEEPR